LRDQLRARADRAGRDAPKLAAVLLAVEQVFGSDLPANPQFTLAVSTALESLIRDGSQKTYATFRSTHP
jgi:fructuronate reductase